MRDDLEARYHHPAPSLLKIMPEGFALGGETVSCIDVSIQDEQVERKLWDHGRLLCRSHDGRRAVKTHKPCRVCRDQLRCTSQIVLYVLHDDTPYRLPLNYTSAENYLAYRREVMNGDADPTDIMTTLHVTPRGTWGEVSFTKLF